MGYVVFQNVDDAIAAEEGMVEELLDASGLSRPVIDLNDRAEHLSKTTECIAQPLRGSVEGQIPNVQFLAH